MRRIIPAAALALALCGLACHSSGQPPPGISAGAAGAGVAGEDGGGSAGDAGHDAGEAGRSVDGAAGDGAVSAAFDPGWVGMRRLSDAEYARTLQDVLGLDGQGASLVASFAGQPDFVGRVASDYLAPDLFDTRPIFDVSAPRYEVYFDHAVRLVGQAFASDALRARIVTCAPTSATDDTCAAAIVRAFGLRAWRRPLTDTEVTDLVALARADLDAGDDFASAIQQPLVAMLCAESFLYRIELDPPAPDVSVHALTSYELASRLSYLLWSTLPDDALFALAATDELQHVDALTAQVTRMLADARSDGFVRNFFGQWLAFRELDVVPLDRVTPRFSSVMQASMFEEARLFVSELVQSDRGIGELLTADANFIDAQLAGVYGVPIPPVPFSRTVLPGDARKGYLGLAGFLTQTSWPHGTSPFRRGAWIDEALFCMSVPPPPPNDTGAQTSGTPQQQYQARAAMPACASCHELFEPVGLGLESFDEIGQLRATYPDRTPIDATGALPDGRPYTGVIALADLASADARFAACARREALVYTLGRPLTDADAGRLAAIDARWSAAGGSVRGLLAAIVVDDLFRYRRGETQP